MALFKQAIVVAGINLRRWQKDTRIWLILAFTVLFVIKYIKPFAQYGIDTGQECTPLLLPFLFSRTVVSMGVSKILLHVLMLLLFCDAPFFFPMKPYIISRSRRNGWWMGDCIYIMTAALIYVFFITLISFFVLLPVADWADNWGTVIRDFRIGDGVKTAQELSYEYKVYVPEDIVRYLYPSGTQLYTFFSAWATFTFLGLLIYLVSLIWNRVLWGILLAAFFVFLDPCLQWLASSHHYWILIFSPVSWNSIGTLNLLNVNQKILSVPFVVAAYLLLIAILLLCISIYSKRKAIEI